MRYVHQRIRNIHEGLCGLGGGGADLRRIDFSGLAVWQVAGENCGDAGSNYRVIAVCVGARANECWRDSLLHERCKLFDSGIDGHDLWRMDSACNAKCVGFRQYVQLDAIITEICQNYRKLKQLDVFFFLK